MFMLLGRIGISKVLSVLTALQWDFIAHLSHELYNFCQIFFFLQNLFSFGPQRNKLCEVFIIVLIQGTHILAVAD